MFWFFLSLFGYFLLAIVFVLDKIILTKSVSKPVVYTFYSTVFLLAAFFAWPFGVEMLAPFDLLIALVSGITFGLGMLTMFVAVKKGEASHINPFIGGTITVATYILSFLFLGETLTGFQVGGVLLLVFASLLLSFEKSRAHNGFHVGFLWGVAAAILFAFSLVTAKYLYEGYPFLTGLVWSRGTAGIFGLLLLISPAVRQTFRRHGRKKIQKTFGKQHAMSIVATNKILSIVGVVILHYAIAIGSVTLVNAMAGVQYVFMFCMIYFFTKMLPKVLREYFTKREATVEIVGLALVIMGSAFLVFY